MNILIVTPGYPYKKINSYSFVQQVVNEFARQGNNCVVVAPFSVLHNRTICREKEELRVDGGSITVYRPNVLSFSNLKLFGYPLSHRIRQRRINQMLAKLPYKPDVVYCHFWRSGCLAYDYAKNNQLPLFVATGESKIEKDSLYVPELRPFCDYVRGVVAVSSKNKKESISLGLTTEDKCVVIPNAVNTSLFHPMDRSLCRDKLSIPQDYFVLVYVGLFNRRKGAARLSEAIERISGRPVYSLFIGEEGGERPTCGNMLYCGKVSHAEIPVYLNAADVFVLPTLKEGCCNAIVEAMACGLPVISSDRDFNDDILNDENSIRVNPMDVDAIAAAIVRLRDDEPLRREMSASALASVSHLRIEKRCESILGFIKSKL